MDKLTHIGLDVHKDTIAVATLRPGTITCDEHVIPNTPEALRILVSAHRDTADLRTCYEAGPTGYDTHRLLTELGVPCDVIAPALIPRRVGARVKTDRVDARNLAHLYRAGELTAIRVPSAEEEAVRDLIRTREDLKADRRISRQRIKAFLLRHGRRYAHPRSGWTGLYNAWVRSQTFEQPATQTAFDHLVAAHSTRNAQMIALDAEIVAAAELPGIADTVARLRCLRGIDTLSAVTLAAEACDFRRFTSAASFMAFTGLVPSEHSSGAKERRGSITKTGNAHIRRVLVEAAWSYRHRPAVGVKLAARHAGQPPAVVAYAWSAQCRLSARFHKLSAAKGVNKAAVAVARELAGFVWGISTGRIAV